ncbi:MAG: recombinase family protein [Actinomycetota bacterium]|nr:recombinase family protein [Actinomycetota bacterium]
MLREIYDNSLTVLYRLLFVLYAESRDLLPVHESEMYRDTYSLYAIKHNVARERPLLPSSATLWPKVRQLFHIINEGSPPLSVATFNGGLFDPARHTFLERYTVGDGHLQQAIDKLACVHGQFVDYRDCILDQLAKFERAKFAQRSRRGMLRKAREAGVCSKPPYGFRVKDSGSGLEVSEPEMMIAGKVFRMAAEGFGLHAIQTRLYHEGILSPTGKPVWDVQMIKKLVENDAYRPHTFEEVSRLVSPEVASNLDPEKRYGIQWYNRQKTTTRTVSEPDGNGGRRYRKRRTFQWRPREEWIAIPIELGSHLPEALVDQARAAFEASKADPRRHLSREWELRGLMRCSCGAKIRTRTTKDKRGGVYHYYICGRRGVEKKACGCTQGCIRAEPTEAEIWSFVSGLLKDPERIRAGMEKLIE